MFYYAVAGNAFGQDGALQEVVFAKEQGFDTPVLIPKLNLEMQYLLTIAHKPKMPRFNNPRMHRPYAYLMKFFALDAKKRIGIHNLFGIVAVERVANRLEPWMIRISNSMVLVELAFKLFKIQALCSKRRQCS